MTAVPAGEHSVSNPWLDRRNPWHDRMLDRVPSRNPDHNRCRICHGRALNAVRPIIFNMLPKNIETTTDAFERQ
jgi:hypothetical protein